MAIDLLTITVRHERRIRLGFSRALAMGAFTSTAFYTLESLDAAGEAPAVQAALLVASSPSFVELQLAHDLVQSGRYRVSAVGVPGDDASTTPDPSELDFTLGRERAASLGAVGPLSSLERVLYGVDLLLVDGDWQETPDGDLATMGGLRLAQEDMFRRLLSDGLPWDPTYGLRARQEVDGSPQALLPLRSRALAEARRDDRIESVTASIDLSDPAAPVLTIAPRFLGAAGAAPSLQVPLS